jgi:preprotein translocase subunit SecY
MAFKDTYIGILEKLPSITSPIKKMTFREKIKWTIIILLLYFFMTQITVYGVSSKGYEYFQYMEMILGSKFGSIMTLGIGPIVSASIILQLLVGSKVIPWDLKSPEGKKMFQGTQKLMAIIFSLVEAGAFVLFGAIPASSPELVWLVIIQIAAGGWLVIFMDEVISKWGFGSGVSLFIVAGVASGMIVRIFNPITIDLQTGVGHLPGPGEAPAGLIPNALVAIGGGDFMGAFLPMLPILATVLVFFIVIYSQAIRVEVPLAFGSIRGFGRRWPLKFFYTSNIPVILVAALLANVQIMARMASDKGMSWLGSFDSQGGVTGGLIFFLTPPRSQSIEGFMISAGAFALLGIVVAYFTKKTAWKLVFPFAVLGVFAWFITVPHLGLSGLTAVTPLEVARMLTYTLMMVAGSVVFSYFWVSSAGMDPKTVAEQIQSTGMQIPGYRRDPRVIESVLTRYIMPLAIMGGASVGALAAYADFTGAIGTGTGILLATTIIYNMYEEITVQNLEDMHPAVRKMLGQ